MNPHLEPWSVSPDAFPADGFISDRLEHLLQYAILAPSPHNTQPWLFRINTNDVEVFADLRRCLKASDPQARELHLACGAALLNLRIAGEYFAQRCSVEVLPEPLHPTLVARLTLHAGGEATSEDVVLFHAIRERRTNRGEFSATPVPEAAMDALGEAAVAEGAWLSFVTDEASKDCLAGLVAEGDRVQWADRAFRSELAQWVRTDAAHQMDGIPGADFGVQDWMSFVGPALVRTFDRGGREAAKDLEIARHSPLLLVLGTDEDNPVEWMRAGQAMQRVLLTAQSEGLSVSHLNQPVEVASLRAQVATVAGRESGYPQLILRVGFGTDVKPTPRRPLRSLLLHQDPSKAPPH
jgi:nitroreductase